MSFWQEQKTFCLLDCEAGSQNVRTFGWPKAENVKSRRILHNLRGKFSFADFENANDEEGL